jgi:hypothetical protein
VKVELDGDGEEMRDLGLRGVTRANADLTRVRRRQLGCHGVESDLLEVSGRPAAGRAS